MRPLALATAARACDGGPRIAIDLPSGDPKVSATITASQPQATSAIAPAILLNLRSAPLEPFPFRLNRNGALSFCFDAFSSREPVSTPDQVRGRLSLENALKLAMPLRIDQPVDPLRGGHRETHRHRFAGCRRQAVLRRVAMHVRAIGIGDDQAGVGGKYLAG